jgi:hypothetical protein
MVDGSQTAFCKLFPEVSPWLLYFIQVPFPHK